MITIEKAVRGAMSYVDTDLIPKLPTGKGLALGIAAALLADGVKAKATELCRSESMKTLGLVTEDGEIDIDKLYGAARLRFEGRKIPIGIPIIGTFHFTADDVDALYKKIMEA